MGQLRRLALLRERSAPLRSAIAGWHIEGPFLSGKPGFHGAHDPEWMLDPSPAHIRELREIAGDTPVLLTLAPERAGALEAIALAKELGMTASLGHTDAPAETLAAAARAGAVAFTHLGNGCAAELNRHDNILWRVLDSDALRVSLIPDRIHVSPPLFRLIHRILGDAVFYTTDAMAAAGAGPGEYSLGSQRVTCDGDGAVRQPGTPYLAGSSLTPRQGVARAKEMLGCRWQEAWFRFSEGPARVVGQRNSLEPGQRVEDVFVMQDGGNSLMPIAQTGES